MSGKRTTEGGLEEYIEYAARKAGVDVRVAHGIEPGHARHRPGAPAYDLDIYDPQTGERLSVNNPKHEAKIAAFFENAVAGGATGVGGGTIYMGGQRFHIGGGDQAVWGNKLRRAGAPQFIIDAYERGLKRRLTVEQRTAELKKMRDAEKTKVAGPPPAPAPPSTTQQETRTEVVPGAGTRTIQPGGTTWTSADVPPRKTLPSLFGRPDLPVPEKSGEQLWSEMINRQGFDRTQGRGIFHRVRGRGKVDVTINKSEDARATPIAGPFKKIRMHGQRQNEPASSGPLEPTSAEYDPQAGPG
jgi:hypothetical protein